MRVFYISYASLQLYSTSIYTYTYCIKNQSTHGQRKWNKNKIKMSNNEHWKKRRNTQKKVSLSLIIIILKEKKIILSKLVWCVKYPI